MPAAPLQFFMFAAQAERMAMGSALTVFSVGADLRRGGVFSKGFRVLRDAESVLRDQCDH